MPLFLSVFLTVNAIIYIALISYTSVVIYDKNHDSCHENYLLNHSAKHIQGCFVLNNDIKASTNKRWVGSNFTAFHHSHPSKENLSKGCHQIECQDRLGNLYSVKSSFQFSTREERLGHITCPSCHVCLIEASFQKAWILTNNAHNISSVDSFNILNERVSKLSNQEVYHFSVHGPISVSVSFKPILYKMKLRYSPPYSVPGIDPRHIPTRTKTCRVHLNSGTPDGLLITNTSQPNSQFRKTLIH
ncbi:hypothetical protein DSO57_1012738 [Entomophthora muscae]|uniref:Uncharacterized protein n=1 Tax=Entomophthora muscae TaxID=34485 RepID=A0ACC2U3Y0_9FUNG|nr:hypothetical protein DSO57_1012738 [Entomophthora muscae]